MSGAVRCFGASPSPACSAIELGGWLAVWLLMRCRRQADPCRGSAAKSFLLVTRGQEPAAPGHLRLVCTYTVTERAKRHLSSKLGLADRPEKVSVIQVDFCDSGGWGDGEVDPTGRAGRRLEVGGGQLRARCP